MLPRPIAKLLWLLSTSLRSRIKSKLWQATRLLDDFGSMIFQYRTGYSVSLSLLISMCRVCVFRNRQQQFYMFFWYFCVSALSCFHVVSCLSHQIPQTIHQARQRRSRLGLGIWAWLTRLLCRRMFFVANRHAAKSTIRDAASTRVQKLLEYFLY